MGPRCGYNLGNLGAPISHKPQLYSTSNQRHLILFFPCYKPTYGYEPAYSQFKHKTMKSSCAFKWTQIQVICVLWICFLNLELFLVLAIGRWTACVTH